MLEDIKKICLSTEKINHIISDLAVKINCDYQGKKPVFIGLLKGCNPFLTDLLKKLKIYCQVEYMAVSSYAGTQSTGEIVINYDLKADISDQDVILVDDILDTGRTLSEVKKIICLRGARSVKICVLLDKPQGRIVPIEADYVGDLIPNEFVVGYGLDYNGLYRNLPFIGVLKEEIYSN